MSRAFTLQHSNHDTPSTMPCGGHTLDLSIVLSRHSFTRDALKRALIPCRSTLYHFDISANNRSAHRPCHQTDRLLSPLLSINIRMGSCISVIQDLDNDVDYLANHAGPRLHPSNAAGSLVLASFTAFLPSRNAAVHNVVPRTASGHPVVSAPLDRSLIRISSSATNSTTRASSAGEPIIDTYLWGNRRYGSVTWFVRDSQLLGYQED